MGFETTPMSTSAIEDENKKSTLDPELEKRLDQMSGRLRQPSIEEALILLRSDKFGSLTESDIHNIAEYRPIEIGGEIFFNKAFSTGKEISSFLQVAMEVDKDAIISKLEELEDLLRTLS